MNNQAKILTRNTQWKYTHMSPHWNTCKTNRHTHASRVSRIHCLSSSSYEDEHMNTWTHVYTRSINTHVTRVSHINNYRRIAQSINRACVCACVRCLCVSAIAVCVWFFLLVWFVVRVCACEVCAWDLMLCVNEVFILLTKTKPKLEQYRKTKQKSKNVTQFRVVCVCVCVCGVMRVRECGCVYMRVGYVRGGCAI